jgi:competence protein ComEA
VEAQNAGGVRQVFDVGSSNNVNDMTRWLRVTSDQRHFLKSLNYISGQHVEIIENSHGVHRIKVSWMRAGKRMALGIPLHPDRMGLKDWQDIKGIGPALAQRIVADRQKNGDFGTVANLTRVSGIGEKTVQFMQKWFSPRLYGPE